MKNKRRSTRKRFRGRRFWFGLGLGLSLGWTVMQQIWTLKQLFNINVPHSLATHTNQGQKGRQDIQIQDTGKYTVSYTIEDGIERFVYTPKERRFATPILMQHGMWHGAWCWRLWQALLAEWGWESHAYSLPGHGGSLVQRPIRLCTLDYYLGFLKAEIDRLPRKPVLMGHSMGGALAQWYFRYVGDDLPAAVLVAPWVSHTAFEDGLLRFWKLDPIGCLLMALTWSSTPFVRTPKWAAEALLSEKSEVSAAELHAQLTPESALILYQHNPPFWHPAELVETPLLWLAGEEDVLVSETAERRSAEYYDADYARIEGAAHNLMMEFNYRQTAELIHNWLVHKEVDKFSENLTNSVEVTR